LLFNIGGPPLKIDFLTRISGVDYDDANSMKILADLDGIVLPVLHLNHLVLSKLTWENCRTQRM